MNVTPTTPSSMAHKPELSNPQFQKQPGKDFNRIS